MNSEVSWLEETYLFVYICFSIKIICKTYYAFQLIQLVFRYLAVLQPMRLYQMDRRGKLMIAVAWIASVVCSLPQVRFIKFSRISSISRKKEILLRLIAFVEFQIIKPIFNTNKFPDRRALRGFEQFNTCCTLFLFDCKNTLLLKSTLLLFFLLVEKSSYNMNPFYIIIVGEIKKKS